MSRLLGPALTGSLRYEALMAARQRGLWVATVPLVALSVLLTALSPSLNGLRETSAQIGAWAVAINLFSTLGLAVALADRFARTRRRGLPDLLDATAARPAVRMAGSLLGSLGAALVPVSLAILVVGVGFAVDRRDPAALGWALLALLVIIVPAALVAATFAATLGLLVPVPLARVLVVGAWLWATVWNTSIIPVPTITGTVLSPLGDYTAHGWLNAPTLYAGHGTALLSPPVTATSAAIALAALLAATAVLLVLARALRAART
jgi:ABC-2 type transport system permease protein